MPVDIRIPVVETQGWRSYLAAQLPPLPSEAFNWSDSNKPYAFTSGTSPWMSRVPSGLTPTPLVRSGANFKAWVNATINSVAGGVRVLIDLRNAFGTPEVFTLNSFDLIGSSGDPTYSFGLYNTRLAGFIGHGPETTKIRMLANSMTQAQLDKMTTMPKSTFAPIQMGVARFYSATGQPFFLGGMGFESADQNLLTAVHPEMTDNDPPWETPVYTPQPAPHNGIVIAGPGPVTISHCAFIGVGRALLSQPPFECTNLGSQYSTVRIYNSEFDGRRHPDIDPARPRRCNPVMLNNDTVHVMEDVWLHHSNVSRYAANDENQNTSGTYAIRRFKVDHMTDTRNTDPAINGGQPLGGASPVTPLGWESSSANITLEDGIIEQDINYTLNGQAPAHFQMTTVGARNPQGGRFQMHNVRTTYTGYPEAGDFIIARVGATTYWRSDGYANTIQVYHPVNGNRLTAYEYTGTWPPNKATLGGLGITPETHYIVKLA